MHSGTCDDVTSAFATSCCTTRIGTPALFIFSSMGVDINIGSSLNIGSSTQLNSAPITVTVDIHHSSNLLTESMNLWYRNIGSYTWASLHTSVLSWSVIETGCIIYINRPMRSLYTSGHVTIILGLAANLQEPTREENFPKILSSCHQFVHFGWSTTERMIGKWKSFHLVLLFGRLSSRTFGLVLHVYVMFQVSMAVGVGSVV